MEIANRVGASEIINRLVDDLKDENEQYRKMVSKMMVVARCDQLPSSIMIHVCL